MDPPIFFRHVRNVFVVQNKNRYHAGSDPSKLLPYCLKAAYFERNDAKKCKHHTKEYLCQLRVIMLCICDWSISKWLLLLKRRKKQSSSRSLSKICWNNTKATKWIECLVRKSLKLYPKRPAKSYNRRCSTSLVYYQYSWFHDLCTILNFNLRNFTIKRY